MSRKFGCIAVSILAVVFILSGSAAAEKYKIGVLLSDSRPHLQVDEKGFENALEDAGVQAEYDYQNAQSDMAGAEAIAKQFVTDKVNLVHAIGIVAAQAAVKVIKDIPVVYSSVPDPVGAGVVKTMEANGGNVTGVTDAFPISDQVELYHQILPSAKRWGTIFNVDDESSVRAVNKAREAMQKLGLELIEAKMSGAEGAENKVNEAGQSLVGKVDAIYIARDRMVASAFGRLARICDANKIPLFTGSPFQVPLGAIAALGIDYVQIGITAGHKAIMILKNGKSAGEIPSGEAEKVTLFISLRNAKKVGITVPEDVIKKADRVF